MNTPDLPGARDAEVPPAPGPGSRLLDAVGDPAALRSLPGHRLPELAAQIRHLLIEKVSATGGHLGASLGTVELTIALHRVFDSPHDAILFDTGHQAYTHKILTGRAAGFDTLRQAGGLSGYPSRAESRHDWIDNSHASTAAAYADGLAKAFQLVETPSRHVVAVVGDGALTGGTAWEALNNLGGADRPVVVVLNDNTRSYDPTAGAIARHLERLRAGGDPARRVPGARQDNLFRTLGFGYLGPVDGHDIPALEDALRRAVRLSRPVVVHAVTAKGRGYAPAEADRADRMHAVGVIDPDTGRSTEPARPTWTGVFAEEIAAIADEREDIVALTAAMRLPVGLGPFSHRHPDRVFDSGIAEQHAVTCAAGLAMGGLHPVVCLYSTFLNRACDQIFMDIALHRLPVTLVLDRAGITGPDGPSHHGMWDLALLAHVPGMRLAAPRDPGRLRDLLREAVDIDDAPAALRFPKATAGADIPAVAATDGIDILHRTPHAPLDVLFVAVGATAPACLDAAHALTGSGFGVTVVDPRWVVPVNPALPRLIARHRLAISVEDGIRTGGIGTLTAQTCADAGVATPVRALGLPARFLPHATRAELLAASGICGAALADEARYGLLTDRPGATYRHLLRHHRPSSLPFFTWSHR